MQDKKSGIRSKNTLSESNDLLTDEELVDVTGCKQSSKQADVLETNGIYYVK